VGDKKSPQGISRFLLKALKPWFFFDLLQVVLHLAFCVILFWVQSGRTVHLDLINPFGQLLALAPWFNFYLLLIFSLLWLSNHAKFGVSIWKNLPKLSFLLAGLMFFRLAFYFFLSHSNPSLNTLLQLILLATGLYLGKKKRDKIL
jgi:hypothetical protein